MRPVRWSISSSLLSLDRGFGVKKDFTGRETDERDESEELRDEFDCVGHRLSFLLCPSQYG